jgi:NAD kinase
MAVMRLSAICLLLLSASIGGAAEYVFQYQVEFRRIGNCVALINSRDRQELLIMPENIVAVVPADRNDNNAFTEIILSGDGSVIRLQQRANPEQAVVAALATMELGFIEAVSDRDLREQEVHLLNMRRVTLVERKRVDAERSDTIISYIGGSGQTAQFTINQSAAAYARLRDSIGSLAR